EKAQKPITNNSTELVDFKNLPINKQLEIIHKQSETLQKENRILKREIDRMSLMMELYFSTLMVHFDIDSPDEKSQEDDKKT
ncbi:hypothetical protein AADX89_12545, partial [Staphylococcus epidermidis]|uniref:hypothetical protein n=1 Tax=Staphylococcus epidermidis TaxID=1282 RepID=UPI00311DB80D